MQWLRRRRLDLAMQRLQQRDRSVAVTAISRELGFINSAAFSREFRRQFGCSPSSVRRLRIGITPTTRRFNRSAWMHHEVPSADPPTQPQPFAKSASMSLSPVALHLGCQYCSWLLALRARLSLFWRVRPSPRLQQSLNLHLKAARAMDAVLMGYAMPLGSPMDVLGLCCARKAHG
jgi:hypothetical protein